jgi:L,D-transpeptidase catalytic domain
VKRAPIRRVVLFSAATLIVVVLIAGLFWPPLLHPIKQLLFGRASVAQRLEQYGNAARSRLKPFFALAGVSYPPASFAFVGLKDERRLDLYAANPGRPPTYVRSYWITAASGNLGPKLREGDRQVPEGIYGVDSLNPNSRYHLALRLDYPNAQDRAWAENDGRRELGGDIMIHGRSSSVGCLAIGDQAVEELFVLAGDVGWSTARVVLAPVDLRVKAVPIELTSLTSWTPALYAQIEAALRSYPPAQTLRLPD